MGKIRPGRGGARQPANPAFVAPTGPGAGPGANRTDGGPANAKQPIRRLPDAEYGANADFVGGQQAVDGLPAVQPIEVPGQPMSEKLWSQTELPYRKATTGNMIDINRDGIADEMVDDIDIILERMDARNSDNPNPYLTALRSARQSQRFL